MRIPCYFQRTQTTAFPKSFPQSVRQQQHGSYVTPVKHSNILTTPVSHPRHTPLYFHRSPAFRCISQGWCDPLYIYSRDGTEGRPGEVRNQRIPYIGLEFSGQIDTGAVIGAVVSRTMTPRNTRGTDGFKILFRK